MIIFHIISFIVYLVSIIITYVFFYLWKDPNNIKQEIEFFISWSIAVILLSFAQGVLIYIFWGLS